MLRSIQKQKEDLFNLDQYIIHECKYILCLEPNLWLRLLVDKIINTSTIISCHIYVKSSYGSLASYFELYLH